MIKGWTTPGPQVAVSERTLTVSVDVELVGEFMTGEELEAVLERPETKTKIAVKLQEQLARGFERSRTVGWHEDGNRWAEMVGVTEARVLEGTDRQMDAPLDTGVRVIETRVYDVAVGSPEDALEMVRDLFWGAHPEVEEVEHTVKLAPTAEPE